MQKRNNTVLTFSHSLYDPQSIEFAAGEFAELAEIALVRRKDHTEVSIVNGEDDTVPSEFANYALYLTIQSR